MAQSARKPLPRIDSIQATLDSVNEQLDRLSEQDMLAQSDQSLVTLREKVKKVEEKSEEVRKNLVDEEVKNRVEPGDSLHGLSHIESHRKFVAEDELSVIMRAVSKGIDYTQFVEVNASTLADVAPEIGEIGKHKYTYLR